MSRIRIKTVVRTKGLMIIIDLGEIIKGQTQKRSTRVSRMGCPKTIYRYL